MDVQYHVILCTQSCVAKAKMLVCILDVYIIYMGACVCVCETYIYASVLNFVALVYVDL